MQKNKQYALHRMLTQEYNCGIETMIETMKWNINSMDLKCMCVYSETTQAKSSWNNWMYNLFEGD